MATGRFTARLTCDHDDVRVDLDDPPHQVDHLAEDGDACVAGFAQACLDDRRADAVGIDQQDVEGAVRHAP